MTADQTIQLAIRELQGGRLREAEGLCRQVLASGVAHVGALQILGQIALQTGRSKEAIDCMRRALQTDPNNAYHRGNLGAVLAAGGRLAEAAETIRAAIALKPDYFDAYNNLGNVLLQQGKPLEAADVYRQAIRLRPQTPESHYNLGTAFHRARQTDGAIEAYRRAIALRPDYAEPHNNLGSLFSENGRLDEGIAEFRAALRIRPRHPEALNNLAAGLQEKGRLDEAIACYREALSVRPDARVAGNLIVALHLLPDDDPNVVRAEVDRWNDTYAKPLAARQPLANVPDPDRRLKIGYVSRDLNRAPVGRFMLPLLANHDRANFEVLCYADVAQPDAITERLRTYAHAWRETAGLSDDQLADLVRKDQIDILVDLGMHTKGSRILVFARKPAPVQVTYLAYCGTTGLDAMDYRLTDRFLDPAGRDESAYSERSVRLRSYWCYSAPAEAPLPGPPPSRENGRITFGCLNNYCKISSRAFETWCGLLGRVPTARLMLHALEGDHRDHALAALAGRGIDPARVEFVNRLPSAKYFEQYNRIDVALDPFPYPGGTTSCDALWMGVPVVTLAGKSGVARGGVSILSNVGLPELVADSLEEYVEIAAGLAADADRLASIRSTLRDRMRGSPLMDGPGFARDVERAFRHMWARWCEGRRP